MADVVYSFHVNLSVSQGCLGKKWLANLHPPFFLKPEFGAIWGSGWEGSFKPQEDGEMLLMQVGGNEGLLMMLASCPSCINVFTVLSLSFDHLLIIHFFTLSWLVAVNTATVPQHYGGSVSYTWQEYLGSLMDGRCIGQVC